MELEFRINDLNSVFMRFSLVHALRCDPKISVIKIEQRHADQCGLKLAFYNRWDEIHNCWRSIESTHLQTPFQKFEWLKHWHETVRSETGASPLFVTGEVNKTIVFLLPLTIQQKSWAHLLCWMGQDVNNYNVPLICPRFLKKLTPELVAEIWSAVQHHIAGIDGLYLDKQPELLDGQSNPFVDSSSIDYGTQSHAFFLKGDWVSIYQSKRKSEQRRKLKVKQRNLENLGRLDMTKGTSIQMKRQHIQETIEFKIHQLQSTGARNPFENEQIQAFLKFSGDDVLGLDLFQTYCLSLDEKPIALAFGFKFKGAFVLYQSSIKDGFLSRYSPGKLLLNEMIKDCMNSRLEVFDMSNGEFAYKSDWCDQHRNLYVGLQPFTFRGWIMVSSLKSFLRVKHILKSQRQIVRLICNLRKIVVQVRTNLSGLNARR